MKQQIKRSRFFRAFCHDCNRFLLQSFNESDVDRIAESHGDHLNHEVSIHETAPAEDYRDSI